MSPRAAFDCQIKRYCQMIGEERLAIVLELHGLASDSARERIRARHPEANETEVERLQRGRLELARTE